MRILHRNYEIFSKPTCANNVYASQKKQSEDKITETIEYQLISDITKCFE